MIHFLGVIRKFLEWTRMGESRHPVSFSGFRVKPRMTTVLSETLLRGVVLRHLLHVPLIAHSSELGDSWEIRCESEFFGYMNYEQH
jgi:hypothetical protein